MAENQLIRVKISGQHYTLLAEVIDSANGVVRIVDREATLLGKPVWKVWYGAVLPKGQWRRVRS